MLNDAIKSKVSKQVEGLKQKIDDEPEEAREAFLEGLDLIGGFAEGLAGNHDKTSEDYKKEISSLNLEEQEDRERFKELVDEYLSNYLGGD